MAQRTYTAEESYRRQMRYAEQSYIYGTEAPRYERAEQYERDERARHKNAAKVRDRAALSLDIPYVIFLVAAAAVTLALCINYLKLQSQITTSLKNIETQECLLEEYRNDNDAMAARIEAEINLNDIYKVATEELGMVYANKNQVMTFDRTPAEYVIQNEDISY